MRLRTVSLLLAGVVIATPACDLPSNTSTTKLGTPSPGTYIGKRVVIDPGNGATFSEIGATVNGSFFKEANLPPMLGRAIVADDASMSVVVLGHGLWEQRFGSDPGIIGRSITVDDRSMTVVGVMPASFTFPEGARIWVKR